MRRAAWSPPTGPRRRSQTDLRHIHRSGRDRRGREAGPTGWRAPCASSVAPSPAGQAWRRTPRHAPDDPGQPQRMAANRSRWCTPPGRRDRPVRLIVFLDVSGSMKPYSRFFLQFVKGLVCTWLDADAYLFHTRLIRVTDAIREQGFDQGHDPARPDGGRVRRRHQARRLDRGGSTRSTPSARSIRAAWSSC